MRENTNKKTRNWEPEGLYNGLDLLIDHFEGINFQKLHKTIDVFIDELP